MFWESLTMAGQIYFVLGCVASGLLLVQVILLIIGISTDLDIDIFDGDSGGVGAFTLKGLIAFFAIGGWTGLAAIKGGLHWGYSVLIAIVCGTIALIAVGYLYKGFAKLQSNGNIVPEKAIGKQGEVYLTIPRAGEGAGKVNVLLQEKLTEIEAITKSDESIKTGEYVTIVEIIGDKYVVEKQKIATLNEVAE